MFWLWENKEHDIHKEKIRKEVITLCIKCLLSALIEWKERKKRDREISKRNKWRTHIVKAH